MTTARFPKDPDRDREMDQAAWTVAQRLQTYSYFSLAAEAHIGVEKAAALTRRWRDAGAIENAGTGPLGRLQFSVTADCETTPSRAPRRTVTMAPEQAMWIAIRRAGTFTAVDIGAVVNSHDLSVSPEQVRAYIQTLLVAGYLRVARKSVHRKAPAAYRLIKDTGPLAPTTRRVTVTVDHNTAAVVHVPKVSK